GAVVVRLPVPAVHVHAPDPVVRQDDAQAVRRPGTDAGDLLARSGPDRLHLSGRDRGAGRAAPPATSERALLLVDHGPRRAALLGAPGNRPALHHASRV